MVATTTKSSQAGNISWAACRPISTEVRQRRRINKRNGASEWAPRLFCSRRWLLLVVEVVRDVVVGSDRRRGAVAGRRDDLLGGIHTDLARGEDAWHVGVHPVVDDHVLAGVHVQQPLEEG